MDTETPEAAPLRAASHSPEALLLREALGDELAGELRLLSHDPHGAGSLTGFEEQGEQARYWYVDTSRRPVAAVPGVAPEQQQAGLVLGDPERPEARIWLHPADPRLPALAPASFPDAAATLMQRLGVSIDAAPELLVYRPGRRAMFRMRAAGRETYLKVVRPAASATIVALQESLRAGGVPVPRIVGWSTLGIVVTEAAEGVALTSRLAAIDPERLVDGIDALRAAFAAVDTGRAARDSLALRADWYRERIAAALLRAADAGDAADAAGAADPADVAAARAAAAELVAAIDAADPSALEMPAEGLATVHGDLHVGQLFADPDDASALSGVIDIDTAGLGDPVDDAAAVLGHLVASIGLAADPARADGFRRILDAAARRWLAPGPDRARLEHRLAVHVLAHALAPLERGDHAVAAAQLMLGAEVLRAHR